MWLVGDLGRGEQGKHKYWQSGHTVTLGRMVLNKSWKRFQFIFTKLLFQENFLHICIQFKFSLFFKDFKVFVIFLFLQYFIIFLNTFYIFYWLLNLWKQLLKKYHYEYVESTCSSPCTNSPLAAITPWCIYIVCEFNIGVLSTNDYPAHQ